MNRILGLRYDAGTGSFFLTVQPGVLLADINAALATKDFKTAGWRRNSFESLKSFSSAGAFFFPPDPTETSASIGGMVACNASGARSYSYGSTRNYIEGLRVILSSGSLLALKRGNFRARKRKFILKTSSSETISGRLPDYRMPGIKNAAGYYVEDNMDLVDLFIGAEGTLGVVSEIELKLLPAPKNILGITSFFSEEEQALRFVRAVRGEVVSGLQAMNPVKPQVIEFFDSHALELLRRQKGSNPAFAEKIPDLSADYHTAVSVEYHPAGAEIADKILADLAAILEECGADIDDTWIIENAQDAERLKRFRHALPELVNLLIDERRKQFPGLTKLGTDMAVPDSRLEWLIKIYHSSLEKSGLEYVMFGHVGNNHIHVNILPRNMEDFQAGREIYMDWAGQVIRMGGTVSAEHGIGKIKRELLREMYGPEAIESMKKLRRQFDPFRMFNQGNLFLW
ncbi:putative FAD-linked oxidoreductase [subsurface metagenome]